MTDHTEKETRDEFREAVNMTLSELREWLASAESQSVGMKPGGGKITSPDDAESVGHHMGERIVEIKETKQADLTDDDYADMRKVIGYVHRHMAQKPTKEAIEDSRWRHSLMNWGHDPLKK